MGMLHNSDLDRHVLEVMEKAHAQWDNFVSAQQCIPNMACSRKVIMFKEKLL